MQKNAIALAIASTLALSVTAHAGAAQIHEQDSVSIAQAPAAVSDGPTKPDRLALGLHLVSAAIARTATPAQAKASADDAISILTPFIEEGDARAAWSVGYLYATASGVALDRVKGIELIRRAADQGNASAAHWLTSALRHPYPVTPEQISENMLADHYVAVYTKLTGNAIAPVSPSTVAVAPPASVPANTAASFSRPTPAAAASVTPVKSAQIVNASRAPVGPRQAIPYPPVGPSSISHPASRAMQVSPGPISSTSSRSGSSSAANALRSTPPAVGLAARESELQTALVASNTRVAELERQVATLRQEATTREANAELLNSQAIKAIRVGDYETAIPKLREAAASGYAPAQANLGAMYLNGTGVPKDGQQAVSLFQRAANAGNVVAAENVGRMYEFGLGVGRNPYLAIQAYERAVDLGSSKAMDHLARLGVSHYVPKSSLN